MLLWQAPAQAQTKSGSLAALPNPGPGPVTQLTLGASQTTICQGGSAVLSVNTGAVTSNSYTYAWSPNHDISTVSSPQVVVSPLQTTTYTVVLTPAQRGGSGGTLSVTITVQADCCQQNTVPAGRIVELDNRYAYNANLPYAGDPFRNYPPGTYFHVAGTLTLFNTEFRLPAGSVLLMEPGANVVLDDSRLCLDGGTITAACGEMWGGVIQPAYSHGIEAAPVGTLRPRLLHSQAGIQFTKTTGALLLLDQMDFLHNYQSLALDYSALTAPAQDYVKNCTFDATPALMKQPYQPQGTDTWVSQQHVSLLGDAGQLLFADNTLRHALLGVNLLAGQPPVLTITGGQFAEVYLAGVFSADYNAGRAAALTVSGTRFTFPVGTALPATSQVAQTLAQYGSTLRPDETVALSPLFVPLTVTNGAVFEQPVTFPYRSFAYGKYRPRQVGIASQRLHHVFDSAFRGLAVGIAHTLRDGDADTEVRGNVFAECQKGYALMPVNGAVPSLSTGTAYLSCNSFLRGVTVAQRDDISYGIFNEDRSFVTLANPNPSGDPILKNLFDDAGAGTAGFYALYNDNRSQPLSYYTYADYSQQLTPLTNSPQVQLTATQLTPNYVPGTACVTLSTNGLQRQAITGTPGKAKLAQNAPNPASAHTTIAYELPKGTQAARLLIRRAVDGQLVDSLPLPTTGAPFELYTAAYPAGTYFYTLVVNGLPAATRRLVVE